MLSSPWPSAKKVLSRQDNQPFIAPRVIPFTKYFCANGYANIIGPIDKQLIAILDVSSGILTIEVSIFELAIVFVARKVILDIIL